MIAVLILSGCASSSTGRLLNTGVIGSGVADYASGRSAINDGRGVEGNALMGQGAFQQAVVKAFGMAGVVGLAAVAEHKGKPVLAHLVRSVAISAWTWAAIHNAGVKR